jgi:hypothetical protein
MMPLVYSWSNCVASAVTRFRHNWNKNIKMQCTEKDHEDVIWLDSGFYEEEDRPSGSITTENLLHD